MPKKILLALLISALFLFLYFISALYCFFHVPLIAKNSEAAIKVYPNQNLQQLSERLVQQNIIRHPGFFEWMVEVSGNVGHLRYGEYQIHYPMTAWQLLNNMKSGTGLVVHRLTIVNGWTFQNIRHAILNDDNFNHAIDKEDDQAILVALESTQKNPEGLFYPDTYFFTWGNSDMTVLKTAYQKMQIILEKNWENRAPNLPYQNAYQALIVASLIERETAVDAEKPIIASVILNRLKKNMRLQIDPTVQYGVNQTFGGVITKKELKTKSPYNTYLISGLPPTPICMPSESSIVAALHPADTNYLYYVATGTGGHNFSENYAEHENQVAEYRSMSESDKE